MTATAQHSAAGCRLGEDRGEHGTGGDPAARIREFLARQRESLRVPGPLRSMLVYDNARDLHVPASLQRYVEQGTKIVENPVFANLARAWLGKNMFLSLKTVKI